MGFYPHHPFVFDLGGEQRLCMGHDHAFFQRFWDMPLEWGVAEYLNAARLVLCAGYFDGPGASLIDVPIFQPKVQRDEAQAKPLPIYRFYRN
jgi:hypothetical protein